MTATLCDSFQGYGNQTWNAYNQYLNPYMTGYGDLSALSALQMVRLSCPSWRPRWSPWLLPLELAGAGYGMDAFTAAQSQANLTEAMQAKLGLGAPQLRWWNHVEPMDGTNEDVNVHDGS